MDGLDIFRGMALALIAGTALIIAGWWYSFRLAEQRGVPYPWWIAVIAAVVGTPFLGWLAVVLTIWMTPARHR